MIITEIREIKKNKYKIETDENISLYLYKSDISHFRFYVGSEISEDSYREITEELMPKRAMSSCMRWFSVKDYTEQEVRRKLSKEGYEEALIEDMIAKLYELNFLNDDYYVKCYIENRMKRKSRREIVRELSARGIDSDFSEKIFDEVLSESDECPEKDAIARILQKKHYNGKTAGYEEREKIKQYLFRKGFDQDYVNEMIRKNHLI